MNLCGQYRNNLTMQTLKNSCSDPQLTVNSRKWLPKTQHSLHQPWRKAFYTSNKSPFTFIFSLLALLLLASCNSESVPTDSDSKNNEQTQTTDESHLNDDFMSDDGSLIDPLFPTQSSFTLLELQSWSVDQFRTLSRSEITRIPPEYCRMISAQKLKALSSEQLSALNPECFIALSRRGSHASLKDLTPEQFQSVSRQLIGIFHQLEPDEQLRSITADQSQVIPIEAFTIPMLGHFGHRREKDNVQQIISVSKRNVKSITPQQLSKRVFNDSAYRELFLEIDQFSTDQIQAISPDLMHDLWGLPLLSVAQIGALTKDQLARLSADQLNLFLPHQVEALLSTETSRSELLEIIHSNQDVARNIGQTFLQTAFPEITRESVREMEVQDIQDLGDEKLQKKKPWRVKFKAIILYWSEFEAQQLRAIPKHLFRLVTVENWRSLRKEQVSAISDEIISRIPTDQILLILTPERIPYLKRKQLRALNAQQFSRLIWSEGHLNAFKGSQIQQIPIKVIQSLDKNTLHHFIHGANILLHLTEKQFNSLPQKLKEDIQTQGKFPEIFEKFWETEEEEEQKSPDQGIESSQ